MALFNNTPAVASKSLRVLARLLAYPDAELRSHGDLERLAVAWREASPRHRMLLAMALGDLGAAAALCEDPSLRAETQDLRVRLLDVLGRPKAALAALPPLPIT